MTESAEQQPPSKMTRRDFLKLLRLGAIGTVGMGIMGGSLIALGEKQQDDSKTTKAPATESKKEESIKSSFENIFFVETHGGIARNPRDFPDKTCIAFAVPAKSCLRGIGAPNPEQQKDLQILTKDESDRLITTGHFAAIPVIDDSLTGDPIENIYVSAVGPHGSELPFKFWLGNKPPAIEIKTQEIIEKGYNPEFTILKIEYRDFNIKPDIITIDMKNPILALYGLGAGIYKLAEERVGEDAQKPDIMDTALTMILKIKTILAYPVRIENGSIKSREERGPQLKTVSA